jgi:hypothetical protein
MVLKFHSKFSLSFLLRIGGDDVVARNFSNNTVVRFCLAARRAINELLRLVKR